MRILHIITGLSTGGAERALYNLLQGGLSTEFDSHVISLSDMGTMGSPIKSLGVSVTPLGMQGSRPSVGSILKLRRIIKELQPALIQGWMYHGNLAAMLARSFCSKKTPVVWNIRQSLYRIEKEKRLTRQVIRANSWLSKLPDTILYNSQLSRKQHERFGFVPHTGQVIPNGINCQQFSFSEDARDRVRSELSIPTDALVVGHVARFHPMKDHANFLRAAEIILTHYPKTHFMLSGREVDWNNPGLKQHIPVSLHHQFHLLGERHDVADLMTAMDVLSSSSSWGEAFPNVLGEAMAVGIPCVATDVGDSALIVGDCGVVVEAGDKIALATRIESLLSMPQIKRRSLCDLARQRIEKNFSLTTIVERYAGLYKTIISEKRQN